MSASAVDPTWIWGVPISPVSMGETIEIIESLIDRREASYLVSANLNYAMLSASDGDLAAINEGAALVLVDGMPLVWASRFKPRPLPERVAGSDLIFEMCRLAARRGFGVFFVGGGPGVAEEAARRLSETYPRLRVVGVESPPYGDVDPVAEEAMFARIRQSGADIVIGAFSQPRGEKWIAANHRRTGASVSIQIGASIDFAAGRVRRAPSWVRRIGLEWAYRLWLEPRRLAGRYARNTAFLCSAVWRDALGRVPQGPVTPVSRTEAAATR